MGGWEQIALGGIALLILFVMLPGIKASFARSKDMEKDWAGALIPIGAVVLFVIFMVAMV